MEDSQKIGKHMLDKSNIISQIKQNVLDLMRLYDYNNLKIEISCNGDKKTVKIDVKETNL